MRPSVIHHARPRKISKSAQRHDEGGDGAIGHPPSLESADRGTHRKAEDQRQQPVPRRADRQDFDLKHRHHHADEPQDGADRQVDMAGHDHQHHAGRHDADHAGLDRQVPEVARGQEDAAGQKVQPHPDHHQRRRHGKQPGVDLKGGNQVAGALGPRGARRLNGSRHCRVPSGGKSGPASMRPGLSGQLNHVTGRPWDPWPCRRPGRPRPSSPSRRRSRGSGCPG